MRLPEEQQSLLTTYQQELNNELLSILHYWKTVVANDGHGFYGEVNDDNQPDPLAAKGIVFISRILWTFSEAGKFLKDGDCIEKATDAFHIIRDQFTDREQGGVYWSVKYNGQLLDGRKQIYGQAFCMYGLAAYVQITGNWQALQLAKDLFACIEKYSFDPINGGYIEALTQDWQPIGDLRLSEKDANERKTMNTHLHLVEAYAALYKIWPDSLLKEKIEGLLAVFYKHVLAADKQHLHLFLTDEWQPRSTAQSFGHDIEAAWLLHECAVIIDNEALINQYKDIAIQLADAVIDAIDKDGGLWYEYDPATGHWIKEKHWWPQAEAMVGFFNAWQISGDKKYLDLSLGCWRFVQQYIKDKNNEWFWGINEDVTVIKKGKAGFWKCPYHNGRACLEIISRIEKISG